MKLSTVFALSLTAHFSASAQTLPSLLDALRASGASVFADQIEVDPNIAALYLSDQVQTVFAPIDSAFGSKFIRFGKRQSLTPAQQQALLLQSTQGQATIQSMRTLPGGSQIVTQDNSTLLKGMGQSVVSDARPKNTTKATTKSTAKSTVKSTAKSSTKAGKRDFTRGPYPPTWTASELYLPETQSAGESYPPTGHASAPYQPETFASSEPYSPTFAHSAPYQPETFAPSAPYSPTFAHSAPYQPETFAPSAPYSPTFAHSESYPPTFAHSPPSPPTYAHSESFPPTFVHSPPFPPTWAPSKSFPPTFVHSKSFPPTWAPSPPPPPTTTPIPPPPPTSTSSPPPPPIPTPSPTSLVEIFSGLGNSVNVIKGDIPYAGGLIQLCDGQFTLPASLSETLQVTGETTFTSLASSANLTDVFDNTPFSTFFIPSNGAFANADTSSPTAATASLLEGHVITNFVGYLPKLTNGLTLTTETGSLVTVTIQGDNYFINDAMIISSNIILDNGVAHVIDQILAPAPKVFTGAASSTIQKGSMGAFMTEVAAALFLAMIF